MPPRTCRQHASAQRPGSSPGPGPVPGPTLPLPAPPVVQQHPFHAPPLPLLEPLYAGGHPAPVGGSQYHPSDLGTNALRIYAQHPYGAPLAPYLPFHPAHFTPYPGVSNAQLQLWGYGHYPTGPLLNPVPHPVAMQPDNTKGASPVQEAQGHTTAMPSVGVVEKDTCAGASGMDKDMGAVQPTKSYPNKQVSPGGKSLSAGETLTADVPKFGSFWLRLTATRLDTPSLARPT